MSISSHCYNHTRTQLSNLTYVQTLQHSHKCFLGKEFLAAKLHLGRKKQLSLVGLPRSCPWDKDSRASDTLNKCSWEKPVRDWRKQDSEMGGSERGSSFRYRFCFCLIPRGVLECSFHFRVCLHQSKGCQRWDPWAVSHQLCVTLWEWKLCAVLALWAGAKLTP